jgi:hypothetical protein
VWASFLAEQPKLQRLPAPLPEPFDLVAQRRVGIDATVAFEGRSYSVPFRFAGQEVELRGCAETVQVWAEGAVVAEHPRHTRARVVFDPRHWDGPSTDRVEAPVPLGRMGRRLQELWDVAPERLPIDLYAALARTSVERIEKPFQGRIVTVEITDGDERPAASRLRRPFELAGLVNSFACGARRVRAVRSHAFRHRRPLSMRILSRLGARGLPGRSRA